MTNLPGVGPCQDLPTQSGPRVGVVTRASGRRELVIYSMEDPDAVEHSSDLSKDEQPGLGELAAGYVLLMALAGPLAARCAEAAARPRGARVSR